MNKVAHQPQDFLAMQNNLENNTFLDAASQSPIAFDKSAILPITELEVEYELVLPTTTINPDQKLSSHQPTSPIMKSNSNLFLGIVLSLIAALASAYAWGKTTMLLDKYVEQHHYAYMAIVVGLTTGLFMRWGGRGRTPLFGIVAVLIAILGCFVGNILAAVEPIVESFQLSYYETFTTFDIKHLWGFLKDRFQYLDIAFYAVSILLAFTVAYRKPKKLFR